MLKLLKSKMATFEQTDCYVSVSGGVDSMCLLDVLRRSKNVQAIHINHGTGEFARASQELVECYCDAHNIHCNTSTFINDQPKSNKECVWRNFRYDVYQKFDDKLICQAHTLNDQVEQYLMSAIKGSKRTIAIEIGNVFRPFLDVEKYLLYEYAHKYNVPYIEDPTNYEVDGGYDNQRAFVRNVLLPNAMIVNSGLFKTVRKFVSLKLI